jgi:hypothetical protein
VKPGICLVMCAWLLALSMSMCMQARVIRVPVHIHELMARLAQEDSDFRSRHGYAPSQLQLAGLMGITLERLQTMVKVSLAPAQRRALRTQVLRCCLRADHVSVMPVVLYMLCMRISPVLSNRIHMSPCMAMTGHVSFI